MKREAYGDDGPMQKRHRHTDEEITFLIPSKVAGSIIGKGGSNISKLRSQFKASITVPDCLGPERVLTITAADMELIMDIVKEILPNLADNQRGNSDELDIRLLIHQSRAGCVIGKAGSKIKELREKTGARLKIFSSPAPQSTERVVQLVGSGEAIAAGIREVLELIRQVPIRGAVQNYDPHNYDDFYAEEYGGFGNGQDNGRGPPSRGPPSRGPRMPPGNRGPPPRGPPMSRNGPPQRPFNDGSGPRGNFGPPRGNFSGGSGFNRGSPNFGNNNSQQETTTQVTIPKDLAGAIIGKAGSRIRKIRADSGASIEIAEPLPGASDRVITISGTPHRIQIAQYLLQQSVHESNPSLGGRGGNY
ncbi:heterogeneous nuclear ribonucleoprotein K isoform X1 [Pieris rapae]|uniref:heterogeneous nuclear ribonucleoprotein K isoform X1 n=2 Tax=Pieris rapae TaxID=64459 RepID=UPI001E280770|nr:heterogeneous nuclear ribonucleoprotein K isoform X1 [Pieris rapae]XP_022112872.2 heterogeneous nuclear ribonucleoprotein K isoform X1 [Pieris rapae]XP_045490553.1 heterogeneous nuclear ribonucleoprotein K isoform X1 [Pieris rapae]